MVAANTVTVSVTVSVTVTIANTGMIVIGISIVIVLLILVLNRSSTTEVTSVTHDSALVSDTEICRCKSEHVNQYEILEKERVLEMSWKSRQ